MLDKSSIVTLENIPTTPRSPLNYNETIIKKLGVTEKDSAAFSSELYLLLGNAHGNKIEVANGENYTAENTTGLFAQLGAWYERQPNKELARKRLLQSEVIFYDGKKIKQTNEQYGRKIGDTVIASHHQSFGAHNYNPDLAKEYETVNCSLGGDEGFAMIIPRDPAKALDLNKIKEDIDNNTKKILARWLQGQLDGKSLPNTFWEKNLFTAPLKDIGLDKDVNQLYRASDGAATIELIVDKIKKYSPGEVKNNDQSSQKTIDDLLFLAESTTFAVDKPYKPRVDVLLPDKIIKIRDRLKNHLGGNNITQKQSQIINILADRSPYSELFTRQAILEKAEFSEVVENVLKKNNSQNFEQDSLEHTLKEAENEPLDSTGLPRRWQYLVTSSRYSKQLNNEGRLLGTQELWMASDSIRNSLNSLDMSNRSCVGKSGGSFVILAYASDNESLNMIKNIYEQEIKIRKSSGQEVVNPLDLHLTVSTHDAIINENIQNEEDDGKLIQFELDKNFALHYKVEIWQAMAQSVSSAAIHFLNERKESRVPQALSILSDLLSGKEPDELFKQANQVLQSASEACRNQGLSVISTERVLPIREMMANRLRLQGRQSQ